MPISKEEYTNIQQRIPKHTQKTLILTCKTILKSNAKSKEKKESKLTKENPRTKWEYTIPYLTDKKSSMCDEPTGTTARGTPPLQGNKGGVRGGRGSL